MDWEIETDAYTLVCIKWASQVTQVVKKKNPPATEGDTGSISGLEDPLGGGNGNPVFLPGKSLGQKSPVVYSLCGRKESDTTEHVHTCIR